MPRAIQWSFLRRPDLGKGFWNKRESQAELEEKCKKIVRGMLVRGCRVRFNENGGLLLSILLSPFYVFRILQLLRKRLLRLPYPLSHFRWSVARRVASE